VHVASIADGIVIEICRRPQDDRDVRKYLSVRLFHAFALVSDV